MKRLLLFIALVILLASCAPSTPPEPITEPELEPALLEPVSTPVFAEPTFMLDKLPELPSYEQQEEIANRYYDAPWVDELRPADDYGRLYPYVGKIKGNGWWASNAIYGLADETGCIVVDPVYLYTYSYDGYLTLTYLPNTEDDDFRQVFEATEGFADRTRYQFASIDGRWVSEPYYGDNASLQEGRIIIEEWSGSGDYWNGEGQSFRIYNLDGQLLNEVQGRFQGFNEGRGLVSRGGFYEYIDLDGNIVIPGPFIEALRFENGRAQVAVGENYEHRMVGVIDLNGNYLETPLAGAEMNYSSYQGDYQTFYQTDAEGVRKAGLWEKDRQIIVPAKYDWLDLDYQNNTGMAVGCNHLDGDQQEYYLIDLENGVEQLIDIGLPLFGVYLMGDWINVSYEGGAALVKGDHIYRFDAPGEDYINIRHIQGQLFALNKERRNEAGRTFYSTDIFDAASGKVVKTVEGWHYSSIQEGDLLVFYMPSAMDRYLVLESDYSPAFGGQNFFSSISYMEGGLYAARTTLMSGLMTKEGRWLLRVFVNNLE